MALKSLNKYGLQAESAANESLVMYTLSFSLVYFRGGCQDLPRSEAGWAAGRDPRRAGDGEEPQEKPVPQGAEVGKEAGGGVEVERGYTQERLGLPPLD